VEEPVSHVNAKVVWRRLEGSDLYAHYQSWRRLNHVRPFAAKAFSQVAKEEIEITFGLKVRHDLPDENQRSRRAWKGLAFVELADEVDDRNASCSSVG